MISISFAPNLSFDDFLTSLKLFSRILNDGGTERERVARWFLRKFPNSKKVYLFSQAREAEFFYLKNIGIKKGDLVALQAFTCSAVIYPILWCGARPLYIDISEKDYGMDIEDLKRKINSDVKAVIVQHTFGIGANILEIKKICKTRNIPLIEDSAHIVDTTEKKLGSFGDASLFSFGREKAASAHSGGALLLQNDIPGVDLDSVYKRLSKVSMISEIHSLVYILVSYIVLRTFGLSSILGKVLFTLFKSAGIFDKPVNESISEGHVKKMGAVNAGLLLNQLKKLERMNEKRVGLVTVYNKILGSKNSTGKGPLLRYPILSMNRSEILKFFRKKNIYLGDWYSHIVDPKETDLSEMLYDKGSCPEAERIAARVINLPCNPTLPVRAAESIATEIKKYV